MDRQAASFKQEPVEADLGLEPVAIKQELLQTEIFSIKEEVPELEEAMLEDCSEVRCVHIKEEELDIEPAYIHRVFPDAELFCMTDCGHAVADSQGQSVEGKGDPVTGACVPHTLLLSDRPGACPHGRGTPQHFTIHADSFTPRINFPCPRDLDPDHKPYLCGACGKAFRRLDHLRRHQSMHSGEKPFRCSSCDKRFSLRRSQEAHQRHCRGAHGCRCPVCGDVFQSFSNLQQHQRIHDGEKSYECSRCGQNDKQSNYYRQHQRVHRDDDRPYLCSPCEQRTERREKD